MAFQLGKRLDGLAGFLMGQAEFVETLRIEPELSAGAEEMRESRAVSLGMARVPCRICMPRLEGTSSLRPSSASQGIAISGKWQRYKRVPFRRSSPAWARSAGLPRSRQ
jgi:hypothetical protein